MLFPQFLPNHNAGNGPHAIDKDHLVVEDFRLSFYEIVNKYKYDYQEYDIVT